MSIQGIEEIIPHRHLILLVDQVEEMTEEEQIITKKNVTINELFFQGHLPEELAMSEILIVEAMAQIEAVALPPLKQFKGKTAYFGGLDKAKFHKKVISGDTLYLEVKILEVKASAGIGKGIAKVDGKKVTEAKLTFTTG